MKIEIDIKKIPNSDDEKDMFKIKMSTYKESIEGKFERSELRKLIGKIDNEI